MLQAGLLAGWQMHQAARAADAARCDHALLAGYSLAGVPMVLYHFGQLIADTLLAGWLTAPAAPAASRQSAATGRRRRG
jgi:hypothetical protein